MVGDRRSRAILRRLIRLRDAPAYLGMDRNRFQSEVRPGLTEVPIGVQGIAFDRIELDAWVDDYIARNGRPARKGKNTWDANKYPASSNEAKRGTSTNASTDGAFAKALEQLASKKRSDTSRS
jgi:predicted DNA-binding transcriptional regulator AlpA